MQEYKKREKRRQAFHRRTWDKFKGKRVEIVGERTAKAIGSIFYAKLLRNSWAAYGILTTAEG